MDIGDTQKKKGTSLSAVMGAFVAGPAMLMIGISAAAVTAPTGIGVLAGVALAGAGVITSALCTRKLIKDSRQSGEQNFRLSQGNRKKIATQQEKGGAKNVSLTTKESIAPIPGVPSVFERGAKVVAGVTKEVKNQTTRAVNETGAAAPGLKKIINPRSAVTH